MLGPGKDVTCGALGQRGIGAFGSRDEVDQTRTFWTRDEGAAIGL
jgi:hypothetical protein